MPEKFQDEEENWSRADGTGAELDRGAGLSRREKYFFTFIILIAITSVPLGFWQLNRNIKSPFFVTKTGELPEGLKEQSWLELQQQDTDKDGLSDYEEQYVYSTSVYLPDSDSDGISDGDEVRSGKDPLCPEGQACTFYSTSEATPEQSNLALPTLGENNSAAVSTNGLPQTGAEVRQILSANGFDAKQLSQLTDEQLLLMFNQFLSEQNSATTTNTTTANSTNGLPQTGAEVRQILSANGFDAKQLSQLTDEQLMSMFNQSLSSQSSATANGNPAAVKPATAQAQPTQAEFLAEAEKMTIEQIRQLLIDSGVKPELLTGKDEATLREFLITVIKENYK